jgi:hypothetical protein
MSVREFNHGDGHKTYVTIESIDPKTGVTTLLARTTLTTGVGLNAVTSLVNERRWRRAERGAAQPVWELQVTDGGWHPVESHAVDDDIRMTWVYLSRPIRKGERMAKTKKVYVDVTNYAAWKDKMREARERLQ